MLAVSRRPRARSRAVLATLMTLVLGPLALTTTAAPAAAKETEVERSSSYYLCTGYAGCAAAGYSHHGYREAGSRMYWRMYAGHNCTNYVAYRLVQSGMPNVRPWSGSGNATNWGYAMASITDRTPAVGAVAWWRANAPGAGSAGHVAYVERVISPTEIVVSEDSWGGDFHWRRIKIDSTWPTGFIHFNDRAKAMTATAKPVVQVDGRPRVGEAVRATTGRWKPRTTSRAFQWSVDGRAVPGATARTFTPRPADLRKPLSVAVTGKREGWTPLTVSSEETAEVRRGRFAVTSGPTLEGSPTVGETLRLTPPVLTPAAERSRTVWFADGERIEGATGRTLTLTRDRSGARIAARTVSNSVGYKRIVRTTAPTVPVDEPALEVTAPATVTGEARLGETLTAEPGTTAQRRVTREYAWLRDGEPVPGATDRSYVLGRADVGARMAVRVRTLKDGWGPAEQVVEQADVVRTPAELTVTSTGRPRRVVVEVRVDAAGADAPGGEARVRVGRRIVPTTVVDGVARVVVEPLAPGVRRVRVRYAGDGVVLPAFGKDEVEVLAPR